MSEKHFFQDHRTLVTRSLRGAVAQNPSLKIIPSLKIVYDPHHSPDKVAVISGGGAGHEPASSGFVGKGMLAAAVSGDIFASPSARQVFAAINAVPSTGTILVVTNYTGDCLHFGLAVQQAKANGNDKVALVMVHDDVSVPRSAGKLVGRRALAGSMLVAKICGSAAESGCSFEEVEKVGNAVSDNMASIAAILDHCHVPGRDEFNKLDADVCEVGLGLHNEPGFFVLQRVPPAEELITKMLNLILDQDDPERAFVPFTPSDETVLFVGNMGGMSVLEMGAVVDEALEQLERVGIVPVRVFCGSFMTSLNAPGISLTLMNLSGASKLCSKSVDDMLSFVDLPHSTVAWPGGAIYKGRDAILKRKEQVVDTPQTPVSAPLSEKEKVKVAPRLLESIIRNACEKVLEAEAQLTKWDTIVGDGDCGETCASGAKAILFKLNGGLAKDGEVVHILRSISELIDDSMGGTLGAIFSIFLAAFTSATRTAASTPDVRAPTDDAGFWGRVAARAIDVLQESTPARVGHRTVMDALVPFVETLERTADLEKAVEAGRKGGEATAKLTAKLGRATYVGEDAKKGQLPPDPGAMAVVAIVEGIWGGITG